MSERFQGIQPIRADHAFVARDQKWTYKPFKTFPNVLCQLFDCVEIVYHEPRMQAIMAKTIKVYENISDIYILRTIALLA